MPKMPGWVKDSGFEDVREDSRVMPIGTWPKDKRLKEIGKYYLVHFFIGEWPRNIEWTA
jgi:hypothetical protein